MNSTRLKFPNSNLRTHFCWFEIQMHSNFELQGGEFVLFLILGVFNVLDSTMRRFEPTRTNFPPIQFSLTKESFQEAFRVTGSAVSFYI